MFERISRFIVLAILVAVCSSNEIVAGETTVIPYEASYMGIALLNMTLIWEDQDTTVQITYRNKLKPFVAYFHQLHNTYRVHFDKKSYSPLSWSKNVSEGSMEFILEANRTSGGTSVSYSNGELRAFPDDAFTVFSATHYLASKAHDDNYFPTDLVVFIDGETWNAEVTRYTIMNPHPEIEIEDSQILIQTDLSYRDGTRVMQENDILMDVIAREGTRFMLWVEPDGSYSKAQFGLFPKAVVLDRIYK